MKDNGFHIYRFAIENMASIEQNIGMGENKEIKKDYSFSKICIHNAAAPGPKLPPPL